MLYLSLKRNVEQLSTKGRDKVDIMNKQKCKAEIKILPYCDFYGQVLL